MCDCIDKIMKRVRQENSEGYITGALRMPGSNIFKMYGNIRTRIKDKKGKLSRRVVDNLLEFNYCPFCGEKYK